MGFATTAPCEMSENFKTNVMSASSVKLEVRAAALTEVRTDKKGRRVRAALTVLPDQSRREASFAAGLFVALVTLSGHP